MHELDRQTCRNIAYVLLGTYLLMNAAAFFLVIPEGNKDLISRSMATLENLLFAMSMFFYGASVGKKGNDLSTPDGTVTEQVRVTKIETNTKEELKP